MNRRAVVLALLASLALAPAGAFGAEVQSVEFPVPDLVITVVPLALNVPRPLLEPPPAAPLPALVPDVGSALLPRFATTVGRPLPSAREASGTACTFHFNRASALAECGIYRVLQGDLLGARSVLEASLRQEARGPSAGTAYVWLGEAALRAAQYDDAERYYRAAVSIGAAGDLIPHAALAAGWLALRRTDLAEAQRMLAQAFGAGAPPQVALTARFLDGVARLLAGRPAEALPIWDAVATAGPPPEMAEELNFWRGVAHARLGAPVPALGALDTFLGSAVATHPLRADAIVQSGWAALARGMPDEAVRRFLLGEAAGPRAELLRQLRAGLVRAYLTLGDSARARDTSRLLRVDGARDPLLPPVLWLVGEDANRRQATGEAVDTFRELLGLGVPLEPRLAEYAAYRLAEGLERLGNAPEAERRFRELREKGKIEAIAQRAAYRLGLLALRTQRFADARAEGEALLRAGVLDELREGVLLLTAESAARGGDANRAVALFRLALRDYTARAAVARLALGWALLADGEPETALREWEEARLAADVDVAVLAHLAIADIALRQGHEEQSLAALAALARLAPSHPAADILALNRGVLLVRAKAYEQAVQVLEPIVPRITAHPQRPMLEPLLRRALGTALYHLQQYNQAEAEFGWARYWQRAEPSNSLGEGLSALAGNRLLAAEGALDAARLASTPEVAIPASYGLVVAAVRRGDDQEYRRRATTFVERYPGHAYTPLILYEAVRRAVSRRDLDQADAWLTRLLGNTAAGDYVPSALVMVADAAKGRPALARRAWDEILARSRDAALRTDAWIGVSEAALAQGDAAGAGRALEGFLKEAPPGDPRAVRSLALLIDAYEAQGQRDRAAGAAERFLSRFPTDPLAPNIQLRRGHYLLVAQKWDEAQAALEAARDTGEPSVAAPAQFYLGELLRTRGDHEAAVSAYLGATYVYPDENPWAARGLQGAVQSYLARQKPREASILLRKLLGRPGVESDVTQWAQRALTQLGPITGEDPSAVLRKGALR